MNPNDCRCNRYKNLTRGDELNECGVPIKVIHPSIKSKQILCCSEQTQLIVIYIYDLSGQRPCFELIFYFFFYLYTKSLPPLPFNFCFHSAYIPTYIINPYFYELTECGAVLIIHRYTCIQIQFASDKTKISCTFALNIVYYTE